MKITEAPEKIYLIRNMPTPTALNTTNDCHEKYLQEWYTEREKDSDVEYTRTDVFIEKATKWLIDNIQNYTDDGMGERSFVLVQDLNEDFKKYMKGENE